ncbi:MAG TPA: Maf family protein [Pyrinomonadaceae bacterium]|nr:Maf family protein [Pyrinomonadaceae bacterium]
MQRFEKLILASRSPRRAEILRSVGWPFEVIVVGVDETPENGEAPEHYVCRLSLAKAKAVAATMNEGLILGADTTVVIDNEILGQPADDDDARRMLKLLSGRWHQVLTAVALVPANNRSEPAVGVETTRVRFAELSDSEIDWYVSTGEPLDKAGAYGIQEKAALFIEEIEGDYFNVMGLPIRLVYELLRQTRA